MTYGNQKALYCFKWPQYDADSLCVLAGKQNVVKGIFIYY